MFTAFTYDDIFNPVMSQRARSPAMNESEFKQHIARTILESLLRDFPEETAEVVKKIY
jgi:hypothetical protein